MDGWKRMFGLVGEVVFPTCCLLCEQAVSADDGPWCRSCADEVSTAVGTDYCPRCGASAGPHLVNSDGCGACRSQRGTLDGFARVGPYESVIGQLVKEFKYHRQQYLDRSLGLLLAAAIQRWEWNNRIDALVPVPTSWLGRLRHRFYPVGLVAAATGRERRIPVLPMVCVRGKKRRQIELSATERAKNVRGVFHLRPHAQVEGARLCIIDDVATTGSTLREVARVLRKAGAAEVYGAVLAKTPPDRAKVLCA